VLSVPQKRSLFPGRTGDGETEQARGRLEVALAIPHRLGERIYAELTKTAHN